MESGGGGGEAFGASTAPLTWHDFLERMRHPSAADFVKSIKSFIVTLSNKAPDPESDSTAVQEFLARMETAFRAHPLWAGSSDEELESAGEGLEKYVMTKLYNRVFASAPEDVRCDEELHEKLSLLQQFVRPENLDIKPEYQNETSWLLAQKELQKINLYKAPRDKLVCILNCCKVINNLLINASIASNENPPGADEFLPVLIYVTIKANPPQLHSNLLYIQRYRQQSRLVSESAYFFTNILSAESFIWNIDSESLSLTELEFQQKMDSARERLFGLENQIQDQNLASQTSNNNDFKLHAKDVAVSTGTGTVTGTIREKVESVPDLEKRGSEELLKEDNLNRFFQDYPYLFARAGDLTVADVADLLDRYKRLVLQYVSLSKGMGVKTESDVAPSRSQISANCEAGINDSVVSLSKETGVKTESDVATDNSQISADQVVSMNDSVDLKDASEKSETEEISSSERESGTDERGILGTSEKSMDGGSMIDDDAVKTEMKEESLQEC